MVLRLALVSDACVSTATRLLGLLGPLGPLGRWGLAQVGTWLPGRPANTLLEVRDYSPQAAEEPPVCLFLCHSRPRAGQVAKPLGPQSEGNDCATPTGLWRNQTDR